MIFFYKKDTGEIFSAIDGRVHNEAHLNTHVTDSSIEEGNVGKYIIGWIEKDGSRIGCNLDKFDLLREFEDITPDSPLDYKVDIETGSLIKKVV